MTLSRYTRTADPMSSWGHAMFAESGSEHYGPNHWVIADESALVYIETLRDAVASAMVSHGGPDGWDGTADELSDELNPANIVDSARGWDDGAIVMWVWERVLEPAGIMAVSTRDGAVCFDPALIVAT